LRFDLHKVIVSTFGWANKSINSPTLGISGQNIDERQF